MPKRLLNNPIAKGLAAGTLLYGAVWGTSAAGEKIFMPSEVKDFLKQTKVVQRRLIKEGVVKPLPGNPIGTFKPGSFDESKLSASTINLLKAHREQHKKLKATSDYPTAIAQKKASDIMRKGALVPSIGLGGLVAWSSRRRKKRKEFEDARKRDPNKYKNTRKTQHRK